MGSIIYNYQGGAGGEGYAAKTHRLRHRIDKVGKVRLLDEQHNLPKTFVLQGQLFEGLMNLGAGIYLTHHLYLLNDEQLAQIDKKFEIFNIDSSQDQEEIFLLKLFKDYSRRMDSATIPMILNGKISLIENHKRGCLLDYLYDEDQMPNKIQKMIAEYSNHEGEFYQDNVNWHNCLDRIPGHRIKYLKKQSLGQVYLYGHYWDLDCLLSSLKND